MARKDAKTQSWQVEAKKALKRLSDKKRKAVRLALLDGDLKHDEIARRWRVRLIVVWAIADGLRYETICKHRAKRLPKEKRQEILSFWHKMAEAARFGVDRPGPKELEAKFGVCIHAIWGVRLINEQTVIYLRKETV